MRTARMKMEWGTEYHHCVSRVVNRSFVFGPEEREHFVKLLRKYEEFCGVRVITFCILSNHFHVLVEVPKRPEELPDDEELLRRLALISRRGLVIETRQLLEALKLEKNEAMLARVRERLFGRMWDVSTFMQQLKQRFTQWFNRKHGRVGTLWEERFKSVLVEGAGAALATMAAYIDLNPVRAGLVEDPEEYRWCGYGQAVAGDRRAIAGLQIIAGYFGLENYSGVLLKKNFRGEAAPSSLRPGRVSEKSSENYSKREILKRYRVWVFEEGTEVRPDAATGDKGRRGIKAKKVEAVVEKRGELKRSELLRVKVRYFLDGAVLGSQAFVEEFIARKRELMGWKRKTGASRMKGPNWGGLHTLRALRQSVFG